KTYMESIAEKAILFPKLFWAYVNKQKKSSSRPEFSVDGNQVTEPGIIAELFSEFSSAWTTSSNPSPELNTSLTTHTVPIASLEICEEDVTEALQRINPSQQAGPDGVHPAFLRLCSHRVTRS
ncbi:MAG: hypothetical protein PV344_00790, partial [Anaplasma sp.]|nr:hypothetical protein [Anaplasma sp.]